MPAVIGGSTAVNTLSSPGGIYAEWDIGKTSFFYYVCWDLDSGKVVRSGSVPDCKDLFN